MSIPATDPTARPALARSRPGDHPTCVQCGRPIGVERLEALPRAMTCIACATQHKRSSRGRTCS